MNTRTLVVISALLLAGCGWTRGPQSVHRCYADIDLSSLLDAAGVPTPQEARIIGASAESHYDTVFDSQAETTLMLPDPEETVKQLCGALRSRVEGRCDIASFTSTESSCAATTESRVADVTDQGGRRVRRPSRGRLSLLAESAEGRRTRIVLTTTEWGF